MNLIKLDRVLLSRNIITMSSLEHLSSTITICNTAIKPFHASCRSILIWQGTSLHRTVIVTANVYWTQINTGYTSIPIRMKLTYRELCFCYPVIWSNISFSLNYTLICQVNNTDFTWTLKHITSNHSYAQLCFLNVWLTFRIQTLGLLTPNGKDSYLNLKSRS